MKPILNFWMLITIVFSTPVIKAQDSTQAAETGRVVKVHIIHGSKALRKFKKTEYHMLGGLRGGHVVTEIGDSIYGFQFTRWKFHLFPKKKKNIGTIQKENAETWKKEHEKVKITTIEIPVSNAQLKDLISRYGAHKVNVPYDYAFFGMRCAASCYEMLSGSGVLKKRKHGKVIMRYFYPRPLRKHLVRLAKENNYKITISNGSDTRRWEKDYRR